MAVSLKNVKKTVSLEPPRIICYGTPGVGKSTLGASIEDVIAFKIEDGLDGIPVAKYPVAEDRENPQAYGDQYKFLNFAEVMNAIIELWNQEHDFKALMVDSISALEQLIWAQVCAEHGARGIEDIGYGKGYKYALPYWKQFLTGLDALREKKKMTIFLVGHAEVKKFDDPMGEAYDRYRLKIHEQASPHLVEWADMVLFADQKTSTIQKELGFKKKSTKAYAGNRVMYTIEDPRFVAKNRYGLPQEIPLDWNVLVATMAQCITTNHNPAPVIEPDPQPTEVIAEIGQQPFQTEQLTA